MEAEAKSQAMEQAPDQELWSSILASYGSHDLTAIHFALRELLESQI